MINYCRYKEYLQIDYLEFQIINVDMRGEKKKSGNFGMI